MSWWGGGEIRATPGWGWGRRGISAETLWAGSWPPSPGLEPWAILIWSSTALARYAGVTPKRPEATCLMAELRSVPKRSGSSPPSPLLERPPTRLRAMARVSWASGDSEPRLMAAVENRARISAAGSTSSRGTRGAAGRGARRARQQVAQGGGGALVDQLGEVPVALEPAALDRLLEQVGAALGALH